MEDGALICTVGTNGEKNAKLTPPPGLLTVHQANVLGKYIICVVIYKWTEGGGDFFFFSFLEQWGLE